MKYPPWLPESDTWRCQGAAEPAARKCFNGNPRDRNNTHTRGGYFIFYVLVCVCVCVCVYHRLCGGGRPTCLWRGSTHLENDDTMSGHCLESGTLLKRLESAGQREATRPLWSFRMTQWHTHTHTRCRTLSISFYTPLSHSLVLLRFSFWLWPGQHLEEKRLGGRMAFFSLWFYFIFRAGRGNPSSDCDPRLFQQQPLYFFRFIRASRIT